MEILVRASLLGRRLARRGWGFALACAIASYVVSFAAVPSLRVAFPVIVAVWAVLLATRIASKVRLTGDAPVRLDTEIGLLLVVGSHALLLYFERTLDGRFAPALYVVVALMAALFRPAAVVVSVTALLTHDVAIRLAAPAPFESLPLVWKSALAIAFTMLNVILLRAEVARIRRTASASVREELEKVREQAHSYRLLGSSDTPSSDAGAPEKLSRSSVEEIHQSVHFALDLLRRSLDLHTAVLLWLNHAGTHLRISELSSESCDIHDAPFSVGDGVLGATLLKRKPILLDDLTPSFHVPYYDGPCPVRCLAAIPVLEDQVVRGLLVLDRKDARPFAPHEEEVALQAARFCLRAIRNERLFVQLERAKVEQGKLYRASKSLGSALGERDVLSAAVRAAREMASFDLAAITVFDETTKTHEVVAAETAGGSLEALVGKRFAHNSGLVSMVVQNRCMLPYRGEYDPSSHTVLAKRIPWQAHASLLVLPLLVQDRALGTLILSAERQGAFGESVRPTLEVFASHLAVSLANARMVQKLETMATTDGLTGLLNKRAMLESATQKLQAAARFQRKLSVLVVDIDFFKKVNDTFGHDVGDIVIRGLGDILRRQKRATDLVARFGGEEFVVLCEQTDEKGAMLLAERIREELKKTLFRAPNGTLMVTCSIGVATFPEAGKDWEAVFRASDEALYVSKRSGRDRSTAWHPQRPKVAPLRPPADSSKKVRSAG